MWVDPLPNADIYVLGHMLHMFNDEKCTELLKKVYNQVNRGEYAILICKAKMQYILTCKVINYRLLVLYGRIV